VRDPTAFQPQDDHREIFLIQLVVVPHRFHGRDARGTTDEIHHGIEIVRQDVAHHAGQRRGALFRMTDVVHHIARHDLAEVAVLNHHACPRQAGLVDHVVPRHANQPRAFRDRFHFHDVGHGGCQWFLHEYVLARLQREPGVLEMRIEVGQDEHRLNGRVGHQVLRGVIAFTAVRRSALSGALSCAVPQTDELRSGYLLHCFGVQKRNLARADKTDAYRFGHEDLLCNSFNGEDFGSLECAKSQRTLAKSLACPLPSDP